MSPSVFGAARELGALAAEVTDVDWRHPAWLALLGGTALFEAAARRFGARTGHGDLYATYLSANGGPRTDTFMAGPRRQPTEPSAEDIAEVIAAALATARTAIRLVADLADELPDQPLLRNLAWEDGWLTRRPLPAGSMRVVFVVPGGAVLADLDRTDEELAFALGRACGGQRAEGLVAIDPTASTPVPASIAVALQPEDLATARHLHRRAWSAGGGPWLGLGRTRDRALVTTCHLVVDGYGHGRIAAALLGAATVCAPATIASARRGLGDAALRLAPASTLPGAEPIGFAARVLEDEIAFPRAAYAFGRALERVMRGHWPETLRRAARFSPTFQVPLVPGDRSDQERRRRRLLFGLLALRMEDGRFERYDAFRARLTALLPREAAAAGLLSRVLHATSNAPLPSAWRRRLLISRSEPHPLLPPVEILAGRGQLSLIRLDDPPPQLFAASAPSLVDAVGGCVMTLIPGAHGLCASVCGSGRAGSEAGAGTILDTFAEELDAARGRGPA